MTAWRKSRAVLRSDTVTRAVALAVDTRRGVLVVGPPGAGASQCAADIAAGLRAAGVTVVVWDDLDRATSAPPAVPAGAVLVASARLGAPLPPGYDDEVAARTTRLPLRNLTRSESEEIVSSVVGIPLSARLVEALWSCSHGNMAALRATFDDLAARGYIRRTRERMELTVDPGTAVAEATVDPRLWVGADCSAFDAAAATEALTTAALARRVSLPDLADLHGDDLVCDLVARGLLVERLEDGVEILTVQPPALAAALRGGADPRRRREVYAAVLARADTAAALPDPRIVLWGLGRARLADSGAAAPPAVDSAMVLAAAHAALAAHDYRTGVSLHDTAQRAGLELTAVQQAELALVAGSCLRLLERLPEAAILFDQAMVLLQQGSGDPAEGEFIRVLVEIVTARADLAHYRDHGPDAALPMIADAHRLLPEGHPAHTVLDALTVVHLVYSGRFREASRTYAQLEAPLPVEWERRLEAIHALALDGLGQSDEALAILRRLARRARSMGHVAWASEEYLSALLSVVLHGYGITALGGELSSFSAADHVESVRIDHGLRRAADAEIALFAGDLPSATIAAADAIDTIEVDGPEEFLPRVLSLHALALALSGQGATAREQLRRLRAVPAYTSSPVGAETRAAEAGALFGLGERDEARRVVWDLAEDGLHGAAIRGAMPGIFTADLETCRLVGELEVTGDLPEMLQELAAATLAESPRRLLEVARRAHESGLLAMAAAAADRARAVASPGSKHHTLAERLLATTEISTARAGFAHLSGATPPGVTLTRREAQIADLVARGLTNAEIAAELHLSKRTVEGHLNRIYTKTGTRLAGRST
ncbi:helix-turn-helix transcriptional regulator [Dietzia sp. CH92]|uniref:helix-turn-helix transcriptional regulator n=1 Tax=Dietzia sp. CH92 TaxID=3051823 RepID=UPI0028D378CF|nr:helix-turn-helix transcriptional regulator [Dietzia sp. CH92]